MPSMGGLPRVLKWVYHRRLPVPPALYSGSDAPATTTLAAPSAGTKRRCGLVLLVKWPQNVAEPLSVGFARPTVISSEHPLVPCERVDIDECRSKSSCAPVCAQP